MKFIAIAAPLFLLALHRPFRRLDVAPGGDLTVELDGVEFFVPPHAEFEAWTIAGSSGPIAVCSAGGGPVTWSPAPAP